MCESWAEHEWDGGRIIESGTHPTLGVYHVIERRCACGKRSRETRWMKYERMPWIPVLVVQEDDDVTRD